MMQITPVTPTFVAAIDGIDVRTITPEEFDQKSSRRIYQKVIEQDDAIFPGL